MRLLTVSEPGRDGVFFCVRDWLLYLREQRPDWTLDLAYSSRRGSPELDSFLKNFSGAGKVLDLNISGGPQPGDLPALLALFRLLRQHRPDLIHAHSSKAGGLVRLLGWLPGMPPMIYTPHAYYGMGGGKGLRELFFNWVEKLLSSQASTICCSEDEAEFALRTLGLSPRHMHICHHGLPEHFFAERGPEAGAAARRELGLPEKAKILLTVGRDARQKNYGSLYEALPSLFAESPFVLAHVGWGSPELRGSLPEDCRARVHAWEHLSKEKISLLYAAADGYIMTSRYEGFSLAVLEALAEGLPLLLTDVPGFRTYRKLGFDGIRWIPLEAPDFYPALVRAVVDWETAGEVRLSAQRTLAQTLFSQKKQHEKLLRIYAEVLAARAA